jgi:hypothetical protein
MMLKLLASLLLLSSCTYFTKSTDDTYFEELSITNKKSELQILFSHNINGETHPCGCRHHPLGGLPQIAGAMYELRQQYPVLYVDTGDTFFPSSSIPESVSKSLSFKANEIASSLKKLGLKYFVPGDQDFAMGPHFLKQLVTKHEINVLVSNFTKKANIPHQKWARAKFADQDIFFIGVVHPSTMNEKYKDLFDNPYFGIQTALNEIKKDHGPLEKKKIFLLSHSGIDYDEAYAKKFKEIDWIIGAHSQSFLRYTVDVNKARIAQVLSRNHYLGKISIPSKPQAEEKYEIIEARDELSKKWKDNPFVPWLVEHKNKMDKIQKEEQTLLTTTTEVTKIQTATSCLDCHTKQGDFWKGTAHAISYHSLVNSNEHNNSACVGCHSLEYKNPKAFISTQHAVQFDSRTKISQEEKFKRYLKDLAPHFKKVKSIRALKPAQRRKLANKWFEIDEKHQVGYNYTNVQCLNCHNQTVDHPFDDEVNQKKTNYQNKCLSCHTQDQSPEWYNKDEKGIAKGLNKEYFAKKLKEISCPKNNDE